LSYERIFCVFNRKTYKPAVKKRMNYEV